MNESSWCGITALKPLRRRRRPRLHVSMPTLGVLAFAFLVMTYPAWSAYAPAALLAANNLSDLASNSTARTNLGLGSIATQAASSVAITGGSIDGTTIGSTTKASGGFSSLTDSGIASGTQCVHANSSGVFSGVGSDCAVAWSTVNYTSNTASLTLGSTSNEVTLVAQGTPAALTINLPTSPTNGLLKCVKDKANTFATNNATVKTTDSSTIDGVAGATGYVMNQTKQQSCFISDGTNWFIQ